MTPEMKNAGRYGIPEQDPGADVGGPIAVQRAIDELVRQIGAYGLTAKQATKLRQLFLS